MSWKTCTSCREDIDFGATYWECSVSTCNHKRTGLYFCTVACWDAHLPEARHREAWAIEKQAPSKDAWQRAEADASASESRKVVDSASAPARRTVSVDSPNSSDDDADLPSDVLVVVSKLKKYVKAKSDMKTSDTVIPVLSQELRRICDRAIRIAGQQGRKTVLDRDVRDALKG